MLEAEIVCSDESCAVTAQMVVDSLAELELLACEECGCVAQALSVSEVVELRPAAPVARLRRRPHGRLAA